MLIALVGFIGSGKDTLGRHLVEEYGFTDMAFADALKDACAAIFNWDRQMLEGKTPQSRAWRNEVDPWWAERLGIPDFTPRWALQNVGTGCLRAHFHDKVWILNVESRIAALRAQQPKSKIVLTDGRFPNELRMVREQGGLIVRVRRGPEPEWFSIADAANSDTFLHSPEAHDEMVKLGIHISEWAWIGYDFDLVVDNNDTIDELFAKIPDILALPPGGAKARIKPEPTRFGLTNSQRIMKFVERVTGLHVPDAK